MLSGENLHVIRGSARHDMADEHVARKVEVDVRIIRLGLTDKTLEMVSDFTDRDVGVVGQGEADGDSGHPPVAKALPPRPTGWTRIPTSCSCRPSR